MKDEKDSARLGIPVYRISDGPIRRLPGLTILRTESIERAQQAQQMGFFLCDCLTYWTGKAKHTAAAPPVGYSVRPIEPGDESDVRALATAAFTGYKSHYTADSRIDPKVVLEIYADWSASAKDGVIVECNDVAVAYGTFGEYDGHSELVMGGVDSAHSGRGIYRMLVERTMRWGLNKGLEKIRISTQVHNLSVQRVWASLGLMPQKHVFTMHGWNDNGVSG